MPDENDDYDTITTIADEYDGRALTIDDESVTIEVPPDVMKNEHLCDTIRERVRFHFLVTYGHDGPVVIFWANNKLGDLDNYIDRNYSTD